VVAAVLRGAAWKIPALGLGVVVGLGLLLGPRPADFPGTAAGLASPSASDAVMTRSLEIRGLHAELMNEEKPTGGTQIARWTIWRLCWDPAPGARDYLVTTVSVEGAGRPQPVSATCHELAVANGTTRQSGTYAGRSAQLTYMEISTSVSVAARLPDGSVGPASPDIPLGQAYP